MDNFLLDIHTVAALLSIAFIAGSVDAIAGGGGLIMVPALLTAGIPPHLVLGTNKLAATFGSSTAAYLCVRKGLFQPRLWYCSILATFVGAVMGTLATWLLTAASLKKFLPLAILSVAVYVLSHKPITHTTTTVSSHHSTHALLGGGLGFYDGFIGPGTGIFWTTAAMLIYKVDLVTASGIARFMNFISNIVSLGTFMLLNSVDYILGMTLGCAFMLGAYIGIHSALRFGASFIRPVFITVVLIIAVRLAWLEWVVS